MTNFVTSMEVVSCMGESAVVLHTVMIDELIIHLNIKFVKNSTYGALEGTLIFRYASILGYVQPIAWIRRHFLEDHWTGLNNNVWWWRMEDNPMKGNSQIRRKKYGAINNEGWKKEKTKKSHLLASLLTWITCYPKIPHFYFSIPRPPVFRREAGSSGGVEIWYVGGMWRWEERGEMEYGRKRVRFRFDRDVHRGLKKYAGALGWENRSFKQKDTTISGTWVLLCFQVMDMGFKRIYVETCNYLFPELALLIY